MGIMAHGWGACKEKLTIVYNQEKDIEEVKLDLLWMASHDQGSKL